jgi:hypothetical protein
MQDWSDGYMTEVAYTFGHYRSFKLMQSSS